MTIQNIQKWTCGANQPLWFVHQTFLWFSTKILCRSFRGWSSVMVTLVSGAWARSLYMRLSRATT